MHGLGFPHFQQPLKVMELLLLPKDCPSTRALPPDLAISPPAGGFLGRGGAARRVPWEARSNGDHHLGGGGDREKNVVVRDDQRHF